MSLPQVITFNPNPAIIGKTTQMYASGFTPGETVYYSWPSIGFSQALQADNLGTINIEIDIGANRAVADYTVDLEGSVSHHGVSGILSLVAPPSTQNTNVLPVQGQTQQSLTELPPPTLAQTLPINSTVPVIGPILDWINAAETDIKNYVQSIISGIDWVGQVLNPLETYIQNEISGIVSDISNTIEPILTDIKNTILGIETTINSDITNEITSLSNQIDSSVSNLQASLTTDVINPVINSLSALPLEIETKLNSVLQDATSRIDTLESTVGTGINNIEASVSGEIADVKSTVQQGWTNLGSGVASLYQSFNSFQTSVEQGFGSFASGLENLTSQFFTELEQAIQQDTSGILTGIKDTFTAQLQAFISIPQKIMLTKSSDDPQKALDNLLVEISEIIAGITGTYALLSVIENVHPFHSLHLSETFKSILEFVGVYDLSRETLKLFVDNGIGLQAEYAINNIFQARKLGYDKFVIGLHYGAATMDQVMQEAQYEGYEQSSRDVIKATAYHALPPFILEKLIELQMVDNNFATQQLLKSGFDPADVPSLLTAFANLELQTFQANVKTLIYSMYKDGFVKDSDAQNIMTVFAIPASQQQWILQTADMEYSYNLRLGFATQIVDSYKNQELDVETAIAELINLGMTPDKARQKITLEAIKDLPSLSKTEKQQFFTDLQTLGVITTA